MRKYRSWLMGLGIGLIIGASMLQVILVAKDQAVIVVDQTLTRDQLDEQAKQMDLVILTSKQLEDKLEEAVLAAMEKKTSKEPTEAIDDSQSDLKSQEPNTSGSEVPKAVTLYIPKGMNFSEAADKLERLGVIEDADDFIDKAWSISTKLGVGTAVFPGKLTYRQIMNELTRSKEN
jgi:hypothetical protein